MNRQGHRKSGADSHMDLKRARTASAKLQRLLAGLTGICFWLAGSVGPMTTAQAVDLKTVYRDAVLNDPTFKKSEAEWRSYREAIPVAVASLLPQAAFTGSYGRTREAKSDNHYVTLTNTLQYQFNVSQTIFDFSTMANLWATKATAAAAYANYLAAGQALMQRTIKAYLTVLYYQDYLYFKQAYKSATHRLYVQATYKFKEGLIAITDLEEAKKDYDSAIAEEIDAQNSLDCALESLEEISGVHYTQLDMLRDNAKLVLPSPRNIEAWVQLAERQNFSIRSYAYQVLAAKNRIRKAAGGHLPTVTVGGSYGFSNANNHYSFDHAVGARTLERTAQQRSLQGSLGVSLPIYSGGKVSAEVNQAHYNYQQVVASQDYNYKSVVSRTRQAYLGIISYASKVRADLQAITSSRSALQANYASYTVGSRTMADVLTAQYKLYQTETQCANDRYQYILQWVALKQQVGALGAADLERINGWLTSRPRKNVDLLSRENLFGEEETRAAVTTAGATASATGATATAATVSPTTVTATPTAHETANAVTNNATVNTTTPTESRNSN